MAIDINRESLLSLTDAATDLPGRPSLRTLWRWCVRGSHGIRLETVKIGGRRYTSREAIARFCASVTVAAETQILTSADRQRQAELVEAEQAARDAGL